MLRYNLTQIFKARAIERPSQFLREIGFSNGTASKIKQGNSHMLTLRHVEKLCEQLKCTPNDLIEWIPSKGQEAIADHPLEPLRHCNKASEVTQLINGLSYDKLKKIEEMIKTI